MANGWNIGRIARLRSKTQYRSNRRHGFEFIYTEAGNLREKMRYQNDVLKERTLYGRHERLLLEEEYRDGLLILSESIRYSETGNKIERDVSNVEPFFHRRWIYDSQRKDLLEAKKTYDPKGLLLQLETYRDGILAEKKNFSYHSDRLIAEEEVLFSKPIDSTFRKVSTYDEKGSLKQVCSYDEEDRPLQNKFYDSSVSSPRGSLLLKEQFYQEGILQSERVYSSNKNTYRVIDHFPNGKPKARTPFSNGQRHGLARTYYSDQTFHSEESYRHGQKEGVWTFYHSNGQAKQILHYREGLKEGETLQYTSDGTLFVKGFYQADKRHQTWRYYALGGLLKEERTYVLDVLHGIWKEFHSNGSLRKRTPYENGKKDGVSVTYDIDQNIQGQETYRAGLLQSRRFFQSTSNSLNKKVNQVVEILEEYHESLLRAKGPLRAGLKDGIWTHYDSRGHCIEERSYKKGRLDGLFRSYAVNGRLLLEGRYKKNKKEGSWLHYNSEGILVQTVEYKKGFPKAIKALSKND